MDAINPATDSLSRPPSPAIMLTGTKRVALLLLALPLFAACKTGASSVEGEHWVVESLPARIVKRMTGYRPDLDGEFIDFQYRKKKSINLTLRRHFLMNSPDDPFEAGDPSQTARRKAHSIAPDPAYYMHAEALFMGFVTFGWWGTFVPIPVDSLIATIDGGWGEFGRGFTGRSSAKSPPGVSSFKVKNR